MGLGERSPLAGVTTRPRPHPPAESRPLASQTITPPRANRARAQLDSVGRDPLPGPNASALPARVAHATGCAAEVLLPAGDLATYVRALEKSGTFTDAKATFEKLHAVTASASSSPFQSREPVIGILVAEPAGLLAGNQKIERLVELVRNMGCKPVLIPPRADLLCSSGRDGYARGMAAMVDQLDGLLGPGGDDVHPRIYGEQITHSIDPNYARDRFEADFALQAMASRVYCLGICRSHQLWNAARGGNMVQDVLREGYASVTQNQDELNLPEDAPYVVKAPDGSVLFENRVEVASDSRMSALLDRLPSMVTNSFHHQAVRAPGRGLRVVGAVRDASAGRDTIEATEAWNVITVQFHPELRPEDAPERGLLGALGRRARILSLARQLAARGAKADGAAVLRAMKALPKDTFHASDWAWVRDDLAKRLAPKPALLAVS